MLPNWIRISGGLLFVVAAVQLSSGQGSGGEQTTPPAASQGPPILHPPPPPPLPLVARGAVRIRATWVDHGRGLGLHLEAKGRPGDRFVVAWVDRRDTTSRWVSSGLFDTDGRWSEERTLPIGSRIPSHGRFVGLLATR